MGFFSRLKNVFVKVNDIGGDLSPLYDKVKEALEDDTISRDELLDLLREVLDVIDKFRFMGDKTNE